MEWTSRPIPDMYVSDCCERGDLNIPEAHWPQGAELFYTVRNGKIKQHYKLVVAPAKTAILLLSRASTGCYLFKKTGPAGQ